MGKILGKAMSAWRAAEAAKKARELVRRKSVLTKSTLPGKLADCTTSNKAESEIFVVEGDSAGVSVSVSPMRDEAGIYQSAIFEEESDSMASRLYCAACRGKILYMRLMAVPFCFQ